MVESRTLNSIRNSGMSALAQIVSIILNFVGRTFFIKFLNIEYLGINGLFTNILTLLSLAELGVGTAITYMMYEPIAKGNIRKIAAYNQLFRKIYNIIGCFVFVAGLCIAPFLTDIIKEAPDVKENLYVIYILFLLNTSVSYFFTYKRSLLIAHQKEYLNSKNVILFAIIKDVVLIIVLIFSRNYYIYLIAQIIITYLSNWAISRVANKVFPEIVKIKNEKISKSEKLIIAKNTMGMVCHKIGSVVVSGTDNILISSFVGINAVGIFSNYKLIQKVSNQVISQAVNAVTASVGNLVASADNNKVYDIYKKLYFINYTLAFFVAILFYALIDSFITIWLGDGFILDFWSMIFVSINLFFNQIRIPSQIIINSYGVFWEVKWKSIVEAVINLSSSLFFVYFWNLGMSGILLGTIVSNLTTNLWWEPYAAYRFGMHKPVKEYMYMFMRDLLVFGTALIIVSLSNKCLREFLHNSWLLLFAQLISALIISVLIFVAIYSRSTGFRFLLENANKLKK